LIIHTMRHRAFFAEPVGNGRREVLSEERGARLPHSGSLAFHVAMLILTLVPVTLLSEYLAVIVDFGLEGLRLSDSLGGVLVATLVL
jgi:Ca2+:H+ antiporter